MHLTTFLCLLPILLGAFGAAAPHDGITSKPPLKLRALSVFHDLSNVNFDDRPAAYIQLSEKDQRAYWIGKIEKFKEEHSELDESQIQTLDTAIERLSSSDNAGIQQLSGMMSESFGRELVGRLFASMQNDGEEERIGIEGRSDSGAYECQCSVDDPFCYCPEWTRGNCMGSLRGCGIFWAYTCGGLCVAP